jgi:hypothetical protein
MAKYGQERIFKINNYGQTTRDGPQAQGLGARITVIKAAWYEKYVPVNHSVG